MKGLVIDLRSNPGGNLQTVCQMADLILPKGNIVSIKDKNGNDRTATECIVEKVNFVESKNEGDAEDSIPL